MQVEKQKSSTLIIQFRLRGKSPFFTLLYEASFASKDFSVWSFWLICSSSCCYSIGRKLYLISSWINEKTPALTRWPCLQCCMQFSFPCLEKILLLDAILFMHLLGWRTSKVKLLEIAKKLILYAKELTISRWIFGWESYI